MITAAQVELLGVPVGDTQLQRRVGYATQESAVYGDLTLAEGSAGSSGWPYDPLRTVVYMTIGAGRAVRRWPCRRSR
jgi:hypothetical protein